MKYKMGEQANSLRVRCVKCADLGYTSVMGRIIWDHKPDELIPVCYRCDCGQFTLKISGSPKKEENE